MHHGCASRARRLVMMPTHASRYYNSGTVEHVPTDAIMRVESQCVGSRQAVSPLPKGRVKDPLTTNVSLADLVRRYRRAAALTQEELAERAGLSARVISDLERGLRQRPRRGTLALLADALDLAPDERAALENAARNLASAASVLVFPRWQATGTLVPLVGRADELEALDRHVRGYGDAPLLLLEGEPGIGKSRLLREAAERAVALEMSVVAGGCHRRSGQEPFAPFTRALAQAVSSLAPKAQPAALSGCAWLARLLPELAELGVLTPPPWVLPPDQERRLMMEAVGRFLTNVAGTGRMLLVLDDLQWAGTDALDMLAALTRGAAGGPVRILAAYRSTEVQPRDMLAVLLADLAREGLAMRREIGPLPERCAAELLAELLLEDADAGVGVRNRVLRRAGGVPFYLISCAQEVRASTASAPSPVDEVPWSVALSIRQRMEALPEPARELLMTCAVIGRRCSRSLLLAVTQDMGLGQRELTDTLAVVVASRLLVEAGDDHYEFAHDLVREVVATDMGAARRAQVHLQVAEVLEHSSEWPAAERASALTWHFQRGGDQRRAVIYAATAGDQAEERYAHDEAARYYRMAAELACALGDVPRTGEYEEKLGQVLVLLARSSEATSAFERAIAAYRTSGDAEGVRRVTAQAAVQWRTRGDAERAEAMVRAQLQAAGEDARSVGIARLYLALAWLSNDPQERLTACDRAGEVARALGDVGMQGEALHTRGNVLLLLGQVEAAGEEFAAAIPLLEATGAAGPLCDALGALADIHLRRGLFASAHGYINRALEVAERTGATYELMWAYCNDGELAFYAGDWKHARAAFTRADAVRLQAGPEAHADLVLMSLGRVALAQGRVDDAARLFDEALAIATPLGELGAETVQVTQAALAEYDLMAGDFVAARERLAPLVAWIEPLHQEFLTRLLPLLAWAWLGVSDTHRAEALAREALARAAAEPQRPVQAEALRVLGMTLARQGHPDDALKAYEKSLALCRDMPYPYAEAKTLYEGGLLLRALGDEIRARVWLEAARAICQRLGERLYGEHVERALAEPAPSAATPQQRHIASSPPTALRVDGATLDGETEARDMQSDR
jgi:tetratricopeptide (TPR) repeat protein/transcriptional regulator with XRE-family HTH domain